MTMPTDKNGAATAPESKPSLYDLQASLDGAKAKLAELQPRVEKERLLHAKQEDRVTVAMNRWKHSNPGEPFDADSFNPPMRPFAFDADLHRQFHRQHYVIATLERQIAEATKEPSVD
jgi:hypothetical protein